MAVNFVSFLRAWAVGILAVLASGDVRAQDRAQPEKASPFETSAKQAFLYDLSTRSVLFDRKSDQKIAPASLAKLMTATLVFRELKAGRLSLDSEMVVSVDAWRRGGAVSGNPNMLLTPNRVIKVSDLLTGLAVASANDAALTLAENIAGQESRFAEMMTAHARELGLATLDFRNATGFSADGQAATLRDLVKLAAHVIETYPDYYAFYGQREMPLAKTRLVNRNPLLSMEIGADGLATGYLPETGQALIGSAVQDGRRLILGIAGLETLAERGLESRKLLEWGFRRFEIRTLFPPGGIVGQVSVYGGTASAVPVATKAAIRLPILRGSSDANVLRLSWRGPVAAPIAQGQVIATLQVTVEGRVIQEAPLHAAEAIATGSLIARAEDAAIEAARQVLSGGLSWVLEKIGLKTSGSGAKPAPASPPGTAPPS